ncbi:MAG: filamentous hemagglutinin N-terminal domain-containing protein, partial [Methylotenera sp.]|nr:filamentous hemagglutinin N-terminal domain-containing protein [Methylotenera sp.]
MNHYYRSVFNHSLQVWQAVAEFAQARAKTKNSSSKSAASKAEDQSSATTKISISWWAINRLTICIVLLCQGLAAPGLVYALPAGADVQFGQSTIQVNGHQMVIDQSTRQSIINWQSFGISASESVQLLQPAQGVALFRVVGSESTQIFGSLSANGSLFLVNPNGVLFGQGAQVDVGSLVATSMSISNADFLNGHYQFNADGSTNGVTNQGAIKVADGGYIVLLGNEVKNSGTLTANNGSVVLGSAQSAVLDFYGNGLVKANLSGDALSALVEQSGTIQADGGAVQLATSSRSSAVNVSGVVQANSLVERNGVIRLEGGNNAKISVSGTLSAAGNVAGSKGGTIEVTGEQVALFSGAKLDASGYSGGGEVLVGGDYQGKNAQIHNARTTYVDKDATISADAKQNGNGGKVIVWSDDITRYYGNISAQGGANTGNGGFVEVSGKQNLDFIGKVNLSASNGLGGRFLLDPTNIILNTTVQASPTNNANGTADIAFLTPATNIPVAGTTTVEIADIVGFSEAFFQASNDITIANTLTMAVNNSIRLQANNNININAAVTTAGTGSINMQADADNSGIGTLAIAAALTSQAGGITLAGASVTSTAAGTITSTGAANANAGNVSINTTGLINLGAAITAIGGAASTANAGSNGGVVIIASSGSTVTTGAITANGSAAGATATNLAGGNAGSISINSKGTLTAGALTVSGGNAVLGNAVGGNGGTIAVTNTSTTAGNLTTGAITSKTGNSIGTGAAATAGSVTVTQNNATSGSLLKTAAINTIGGNRGAGGNVTLSSAQDVSVTSTIQTNGGAGAVGGTHAGVAAGNVTISGVNRALSGAITATGGAAIGTNQAGGNAGVMSLTGTGTLNTIAITSQTGAGAGTGAGGTVGGFT